MRRSAAPCPFDQVRDRLQERTGQRRRQIFIDGKKKATGTTWEDYYRFDPEQTPTGNQVPTVAKLLFRESGTANPLNVGGGFLVDGVKLASSNHDSGDENGDNTSDGGDNSADHGN